MDKYFDYLRQELLALSDEVLAKVAYGDFDVDFNEYDTREQVVEACIAVEEYAAFS